MSRLIIGTLLVIGVLWGTGVGQTKKTLDPRLILPLNKEWGTSGIDCQQYLCFYADSTFTYADVCSGETDEILKGAWYIKNDTLFQRVPKKGDTFNSTSEKYTIEDGILYTWYGTFTINRKINLP